MDILNKFHLIFVKMHDMYIRENRIHWDVVWSWWFLNVFCTSKTSKFQTFEMNLEIGAVNERTIANFYKHCHSTTG